MQTLDQVNKGITFEQIKNLIDAKHGKWVVDTFHNESMIHHLYYNGWVECNYYGFFGEELNPLQLLMSKTFNSSEEAIATAEKIGLPVHDKLLSVEQIKDLIQKEEISSYGIGAYRIPSWDELEVNYAQEDIPNPNFLLEIIGNIMSSNEYSTWIEL